MRPPNGPTSRGISRTLVGTILVAILVLIGIVLFAIFGIRSSGPPGAGPREAPPVDRVAQGKELFDNHCAACHGEKGDGNGPAARFLYPKPRDFTEGKFR